MQLHPKLVMKEKSVTIGVLSIQGSFAEHICALQKLDNVIARGHSITTGDQILTTYSEVSIIRPGRSRLLEFEI